MPATQHSRGQRRIDPHPSLAAVPTVEGVWEWGWCPSPRGAGRRAASRAACSSPRQICSGPSWPPPPAPPSDGGSGAPCCVTGGIPPMAVREQRPTDSVPVDEGTGHAHTAHPATQGCSPPHGTTAAGWVSEVRLVGDRGGEWMHRRIRQPGIRIRSLRPPSLTNTPTTQKLLTRGGNPSAFEAISAEVPCAKTATRKKDPQITTQ